MTQLTNSGKRAWRELPETKSPADFLRAVMNHEEIEPELRIRAASALLATRQIPHSHGDEDEAGGGAWMVIEDPIKRFVEELDKRLPSATTVPLEKQLWSTKEIGEYLQRPAQVVRERVVTVPGFPVPIRLPNSGGIGQAQPRWKASEVIKWVESHQGGKLGRPRKCD